MAYLGCLGGGRSPFECSVGGKAHTQQIKRTVLLLLCLQLAETLAYTHMLANQLRGFVGITTGME